MRSCSWLPALGFIASLALASGAHAAPEAAAVTLIWTSPGDDGHAGLAWAYDLRYDIRPITSQNFSAAMPVPNLPNPSYPGSQQGAVVSGLAPNVSYYFAIRTRDERGNWSAISNVVRKAAGGTTVSNEEPELTLSFAAPWPNPARALARLSFTLPQPAEVKVDAYDVTGRLVRSLASGPEGAGRKNLVWDLRNASGQPVGAGVYLLLARLGSQTFTRRLTVTR